MPKDNPRARRLGEQIQRELGDLLRREVKDGRIGNVTVTAVTVTGDLRMATVYYLNLRQGWPRPEGATWLGKRGQFFAQLPCRSR